MFGRRSAARSEISLAIFGPMVRPTCCPPYVCSTLGAFFASPTTGRLSGVDGLRPIQSVSRSYSSVGYTFFICLLIRSVGAFDIGAYSPPNSTVPAARNMPSIGVILKFAPVTISGFGAVIFAFSMEIRYPRSASSFIGTSNVRASLPDQAPAHSAILDASMILPPDSVICGVSPGRMSTTSPLSKRPPSEIK